MADVTVRGCAECPLYESWTAECLRAQRLLGKRETQRASGAKPPPTWCPLRAGPLVVRLEVRDGA